MYTPSRRKTLLSLAKISDKVIRLNGKWAVFTRPYRSEQFSKKLSKFLLSCGIPAPKNLYTKKFLVRKGSSFCDRGRLNFQAFAAVTRHLAATTRKALMWVKNITDFGRFCYLNISCI